MIKTILTLAIIFCLSSLCYGQFTKGKILAGGSFSANFNSYNYTSGTSSKSSSISFFPQVGYFIVDNFAAGAGLSLSHSNYKAPSGSPTGELSSSSISFSPFARYYMNTFFGQATFELGSSKTKTEGTNGSTIHLNNSGWSLAVGYAYMLNEHVAIEPQIGYGANYVDVGSGNTTTNGNIFLKAGIQVYLGR